MYKCFTHHYQTLSTIKHTDFISRAERHYMVHIHIITLVQYKLLLYIYRCCIEYFQ